MCLIFIKERKMKFTKIALASMVLGGSLLLSACGGGGGGGSGLSLNGTAATGKPVLGTVAATCKTGSGTAVSNLDGSYNAFINGGAGPCLLKITPADGSPVMYSISSGSGASQTANITPLTSYLVTYLRSVPGMNATSPEAWFALSSVRGLLANTAALNERIVRDFIPALSALVPGLDLSSVSFLSTAFIANPLSSTADAQLEKLKTVLIDNPSLVTEILKQLAIDASNDPEVLGATGATGAGN
jgi:hypothetical protein